MRRLGESFLMRLRGMGADSTGRVALVQVAGMLSVRVEREQAQGSQKEPGGERAREFSHPVHATNFTSVLST